MTSHSQLATPPRQTSTPSLMPSPRRPKVAAELRGARPGRLALAFGGVALGAQVALLRGARRRAVAGALPRSRRVGPGVEAAVLAGALDAVVLAHRRVALRPALVVRRVQWLGGVL